MASLAKVSNLGSRSLQSGHSVACDQKTDTETQKTRGALNHSDHAGDCTDSRLSSPNLKTEYYVKTNTRIDAIVPWHPDFDSGSPIFKPLRPLLASFRQYASWPGLDAYQRLLDSLEQPPRTHHGVALNVVPQEGKPDHFEQHYAPRIFLNGEIQTRTRNWHDFFQLLTWVIFPQTKAMINAIHIPSAKARIEGGGEPGRRTPMENMLSLFDEGGAVLLSSDESLLQLVRNFEWKALFWERRDELASKFECIVFGHAMYEKGLKPYLGMTANSVLLKVDENYFAQPLAQRLRDIDGRLAAILKKGDCYVQPRDLNPFPLLGLPGWDVNNDIESYYDNTNYFRPGRRCV